jgi:hypothetical protein
MGRPRAEGTLYISQVEGPVGFEPTTPGLKDRDSSSRPVPPCHVGASFVSESCRSRPVLTPFVPGFVAGLGDKMATSAESLSIWNPSCGA